jgi:hypothetical protein
MPDTPSLRPATRDELTQSLSFALRLNGRKRVHDADEVMARITAERLVEHLERSGYAVMHKPPLGQLGRRGTWRGGLRRPRRSTTASSAPEGVARGDNWIQHSSGTNKPSRPFSYIHAVLPNGRC